MLVVGWSLRRSRKRSFRLVGWSDAASYGTGRHPDVGQDLHRDKVGKAAIKKAKKPKVAVRQQFGVLPYRETKKSELEVLLVTRRGTAGGSSRNYADSMDSSKSGIDDE